MTVPGCTAPGKGERSVKYEIDIGLQRKYRETLVCPYRRLFIGKTT